MRSIDNLSTGCNPSLHRFFHKLVRQVQVACIIVHQRTGGSTLIMLQGCIQAIIGRSTAVLVVHDRHVAARSHEAGRPHLGVRVSAARQYCARGTLVMFVAIAAKF